VISASSLVRRRWGEAGRVEGLPAPVWAVVEVEVRRSGLSPLSLRVRQRREEDEVFLLGEMTEKGTGRWSEVHDVGLYEGMLGLLTRSCPRALGLIARQRVAQRREKRWRGMGGFALKAVARHVSAHACGGSSCGIRQWRLRVAATARAGGGRSRVQRASGRGGADMWASAEFKI
jgi:hypothetical protein